ncbi:hypothetical protein R5R35_006790 [Gryllus longicercus]
MIPKIVGEVLAVKCCDQNQQLDPDLRECQPLDMNDQTQLLFGSSLFDISLDAVVGIDNMTNTSNNSKTFYWLPEHLPFVSLNSTNDTVIFGGRGNCSNEQTVRLKTPRDANRFHWFSNGSLLLRSNTAWRKISEHLFNPEDFCVDTYTDNNGTLQTAILLCACNHVQCIKKCCPFGQALFCESFNDCDCQPYANEWRPTHPGVRPPKQDYSYEIIINRNVSCPEGYTTLVDTFEGYASYLVERFWRTLLVDDQVCGDTAIGVEDTPKHCMVICIKIVPFQFISELSYWIHIPEAAILAMVLVTILLVPRSKLSIYSYIHDWSLISHAVSLFARCVLWSVFLTGVRECAFIPLAVDFFSIAASFWLNVLCINMTCGFWEPTGARGSSARSGRRAVALYSLYAWGCSAALTAVTAALWFAWDLPDWVLRPTLHETRTCFIEEEGDGKKATFAYFYAPLGALLLFNAGLFAATAARMRQLQSGASTLDSKNSRKQGGSFHGNSSVMIYIKLLWLMGVMEMAVEIASWVSNKNEYYNALIGSCIDLLRAAAIFVLCCCKRRTLVALRVRLSACPVARRCLGARAASKPSTAARFNSSTNSDLSIRTNVTFCETEEQQPAG